MFLLWHFIGHVIFNNETYYYISEYWLKCFSFSDLITPGQTCAIMLTFRNENLLVFTVRIKTKKFKHFVLICVKTAGFKVMRLALNSFVEYRASLLSKKCFY